MRTLFFLFFLPALLAAQATPDTAVIFSQLMQRNVACTVYTPPGYDDTSLEPFPVLYLLHGMWGNHLSWTMDGRLPQVADSLIRAGKIPPMVVVMPDAGNSYYLNSVVDSLWRYEDFFVQELMPWAEATWRCGGSREKRAIGGLSMGGFGAMLYSLHHPALFASCIALSAGLRTEAELGPMPAADWETRYGRAFGPNVPPLERANAAWRSNSVLSWVSDTTQPHFAGMNLLIACGTSDPFTNNHRLLHQLLEQAEVPHVFTLAPGQHDWAFWRAWLPELLQNAQPTPARSINNE